MKLFTKQMYETLMNQLYNKSRDLDVCLFNALDMEAENPYGFDFKDNLLTALLLYQNRDGGFGSGLYIDNYNTNTSVYQIYEALRLLYIAGFDSNYKSESYDLIINKAFNYLYNRATLIDNAWNPNVETNNDFPHSNEFEYNEENRKLFGYHPTLALHAFSLLFNNETKAYYKKALKAIPIILKDLYIKDLSKYEFISLNIFYDIIVKLNLFVDEQEKIKNLILDYGMKNVCKDFNDYNSIHPLDFAYSIKNDRLDEMKENELDFILSNIKFHGLWEYNKPWGTTKYAEEDSAMIKWVGAISVNNYYLLKLYNRIEK